MKSAAAELAWWPRMWPERRLAPTTAARPITLASDEVDRHAVRMIAVGAHATLHRFSDLPSLLAPGDLVVINDAATLPASLFGTVRGHSVEFRLTGPIEGTRLDGILFGAGDWRTRTEDRVPPPPVAVGDRLALGGLDAVVSVTRGRRIALEIAGDASAIWQALYATGAPVQYAHRREPLDLWSVQTSYAARPWAAEMPSAGRPLTWDVLLGLRRAGIAIATLTHAAGLSSTGDAELDRALPWPERYDIPERTAAAIDRATRVIAVGTTVVRALEASGGRAGQGVALLKLDATYQPRVVDGLVSGLHVPGESHYDLLRAFASRDRLDRALALASIHRLSAHELGDAMVIPAGPPRARCRSRPGGRAARAPARLGGAAPPSPRIAEPVAFEVRRDPAIAEHRDRDPDRDRDRDTRRDREREDRDQAANPRDAFANRDTRWIERSAQSSEEAILRREYGALGWRRWSATEIGVAESDMWSPCIKDYVRAQSERARRALPAAIARYTTSCDGDRRVVFERPLAGGRLRKTGSDVFLVGTFATNQHELALRITYCGSVRPRADRAVLVSDGSSWTSLPLVFDPDASGCSVAHIPYTEALGRIVREMIEGREASVRFEGAAQYEDIPVGDELRNDLRVMLDVVEALRDP